jgi:RND family efflux transporter MFP subunit
MQNDSADTVRGRGLFSAAAAALVLGVGGLISLSGCNQAQSKAPEKKAAEVVVTTPVRNEVADYQDFTGRLDALKTVDVRARVSGFITEAPFKEGDLVHEGDLLFQIDTRQYQANLNQAEANLRQAEADRNLQDKQTARARVMIVSHSIGREEYDQMVASGEKARATVGSMEAARDLAKLYLDYTHVIAPLSGRVSRRLVDPGNLVNADLTVLTTIVSDGQLYAYFDVDERTYLDLVAASKDSPTSVATGQTFPVLMQLANEKEFTHKGTVNFIDNRVNASTGTIRMRGVFENAAGVLKSGLFVRIRLPIGKPYMAWLIPDEALLSDQGRKYVYVVNDKNEVVYRPVTLGQEIRGLRVIKKGVGQGERVMVSGMQRVRPGAPVVVKNQPPPRATQSPLVRLLKPDGHPAAPDETAGAQ